MFHYVAPALTSGGQPVQFEYQIVHYLEERCKAVPFASAVDAGRQQLWNFIKGCLTARSSRYRINTGTYWPDGKPRRATARISLTGLHGNVMVISDFYSALGFIISETDSYQYHGRETATEKNNIHLKILAFYTKWITNVARSTYFGENGNDAGPSTACIVFSPTQPFQTVAVPCAMFPNLSPAMKAEGRGIQQENLQNFIAGLGINGSSPRELQNEAVHFGDCAEVLALLYMFNPMAAATCFLHGMTAPVEAMFDERAYNADHFRNRLMPACLNCKYIIRCIHHAMEQRQSSLSYFDLARRPPTDLTTPRPTCDNTGCKQAARREYECKNCRVAWYCSRPCRQLHWDENHPKECNCYRKCRAGYQPGGAAQSAANELKLCMRHGAQIRHRWGPLLTLHPRVQVHERKFEANQEKQIFIQKET
ncbi:hypothetical protein DFH08DRAFT_808834 [Mycena albidolilacea]|uniref:MYND-type domain-containing protein n=1 Tax=Mycena albidolilacea TaxID=1033008 RepID=A0AAD7A287_9AGAR|nr:hypothetical protein DFH08DRAFT_808834 [Mycena albidolilacea]